MSGLVSFNSIIMFYWAVCVYSSWLWFAFGEKKSLKRETNVDYVSLILDCIIVLKMKLNSLVSSFFRFFKKTWCSSLPIFFHFYFWRQSYIPLVHFVTNFNKTFFSVTIGCVLDKCLNYDWMWKCSCNEEQSSLRHLDML